MNPTRGSLFIFSAPSGAGKTSLVNELLNQVEDLSVSVSHTTRAPREGEENGVAYHFIDPKSFAIMVDNQAFFEYAEVFGNSYGTSEQSVIDQLNSGRDVILEIDWQGAQQVRKRMPDAISVFILPPSLEELKSRLVNRRKDSEEVINRRMNQAQAEIEHCTEYDFLVINDRFESALGELIGIIRANRCRFEVQKSRHNALLGGLLNNQDIG